MAAWLDESKVVHYLLGLGLVNPRLVLDDDLVVTDVSRRNAVFLVTTSRGPTLVVKQGGRDASDSLRWEAEVLSALTTVRNLRGRVPELVHASRDGARIVLRSPGGAGDWRIGVSVAGALGRSLAEVHAARIELPDPPPGVDRLWGLTLPAPDHEQLNDLSAGALDMLARLQTSSELCERLERLRDDVREDAFVHGDLRWDNCLTQPRPGSQRRTRVLLIDWELAGRGDAAGDVGAALAEYLRLWASSLPIVDAANPGLLLAHARHPLARLRPAMRAFWSAYQRAAARPIPLRRAAEFAGVRLLQAAIEQAHGLASASAHLVALLRVGANMLEWPELAAADLMGLTE
jgi:aminoglycoside phosphotransferase (APT) family kinase protein